jgi:Xaa-Pro aminopeptidase
MKGATPLLDPDACGARQARLRAALAERSLDAVVVVTPEHVQYLTGHRWDHRFAPVAAVLATGEAVLVCPDKPVEHAAATEIRTYEAKWKSTLRNDQREASSAALGDWLAARGRTSRAGSSRRRSSTSTPTCSASAAARTPMNSWCSAGRSPRAEGCTRRPAA